MKVLIIGGGIAGTMAAWRLAQAGHAVTLIEQFDLDHDRGSSFGDSRVTRRVYSDPFYTKLMNLAYPLWAEFQNHFPDQELFVQCGGLFFGPRHDPQIAAAEGALEDSGLPYEKLDANQCRQRFPALRLGDHEVALFEPSLGHVRASRCVRAAADLAKAHGAILRFRTPVVDIRAAGGGIEVTTATGETLATDRLLVCAGPWAQTLLCSVGVSLPLTVIRKTYLHLEPGQTSQDFEVGRLPVWIDAGTLAYGFPRLGEVPGVKIAFHGGGEATTAQTVNRELHEEDREPLLEYAARRFSGLGRKILYEKVCLYTMTPDEDFVIDAVPDLPGAFFIAGLSGHGFKFGPLLGEIGRRLVEGTPLPADLSRFSLKRF